MDNGILELMPRPRRLKCRGYLCRFYGTAEEAARHEMKCNEFNAMYERNATLEQERVHLSEEARRLVDGLIARAERVIPGNGYVIGLDEEEYEALKEAMKNG